MCDFNSAEGGQLDREFGRCLYAPDVAAFLKTVCIFQSDPSASAPTPPAPTIWGEAQWVGLGQRLTGSHTPVNHFDA